MKPKAKKSRKTRAQRAPSGQWLPGQSGNAGGPKKNPIRSALEERLKMKTGEKTVAQEIADVLVNEALNPESQDRLHAARLIMDRTEARPVPEMGAEDELVDTESLAAGLAGLVRVLGGRPEEIAKQPARG